MKCCYVLYFVGKNVDSQTIKEWLSIEKLVGSKEVVNISKYAFWCKNPFTIIATICFILEPLPAWKRDYFQMLRSYYALGLVIVVLAV